MGNRLNLTYPPAVTYDEDSGHPAPTGTVPGALRALDALSPVERWWVPALTGELRAPVVRAGANQRDPAVRRHRTEDDGSDPLIIPSEWGVF